jgi:hypothetical protein
MGTHQILVSVGHLDIAVVSCSCWHLITYRCLFWMISTLLHQSRVTLSVGYWLKNNYRMATTIHMHFHTNTVFLLIKSLAQLHIFQLKLVHGRVAKFCIFSDEKTIELRNNKICIYKIQLIQLCHRHTVCVSVCWKVCLSG